MKEISLIAFWLEAPAEKYVLCLILAVNLTLTLVHFALELKGFQWRYLGAIAGLRIPDRIGVRLFFLGPLAVLSSLGLAGIAPLNGLVSPEVATACVAAVIGSRLSDSTYIHIRPYRQGFSPNPALATIPYYLTEAAVLTLLFLPGLWCHYFSTILGFAGGWLLFFSVLPGLKVVRKFEHVEPWQEKTPIPSWAKTESAR